MDCDWDLLQTQYLRTKKGNTTALIYNTCSRNYRYSIQNQMLKIRLQTFHASEVRTFISAIYSVGLPNFKSQVLKYKI